jgi:hypothetical protein
MIRIEVEAETIGQLQEFLRALGGAATLPRPASLFDGHDGSPVVAVPYRGSASDVTRNDEPELPLPAPSKKRGRPRKDQTAPAGAPEAVPAPQAEVGNAASAQSGPPSTDGASDAVLVADFTANADGATSTALITHDVMKAALQEIYLKFDPKNLDAGLRASTEIVNRHGYRAVRDVSDPAHIAAIHADAINLLTKLAA